MAPFPSVIYTRLGVRLSRPNQEPRPASCSVHELIHLSTNTRIVPSSSCVEGKPVVDPCSYRPSPSYVLSRPCAPLTPHSSVLLDLSLIAASYAFLFFLPLMSRPSFILWGVTSLDVTLGGGAACLPGHVIKTQFFHGL